MAEAEIQALMRKLPGVDKLLLRVQQLDTQARPAELLTTEVRAQLDVLRARLLAGELTTVPDLDSLAQEVMAALDLQARSSLKPVLNASGILLHTNLGRAPLAKAALEEVVKVASGYSNLELDLATGRRGSRHSHVEELLCRLSGAEAAMVVNNNAGAVLLALTALARGKEAIVSRGELVEIGGSFRIPEVMEAGGVVLREVGSSNRTHLDDYRKAICADTGLLLKVHTSNYKIVGFTSAVSAAELLPLAREHDLPLVEDMGSGLLMPLPDPALPAEQTVAEGVAAGLDILTCSGDKLLGGPQAGLIFGRRKWLDKLRRHPLARALRIDKLSLASLEATLRLYLVGDHEQIPLWQFLSADPADLARRTLGLQAELEKLPLELEQLADEAMIGGGALPEARLPGPALALRLKGVSTEQFAAALRCGELPLVGRIHEDRVLLNLRTLPPEEQPQLVEAIRAAVAALTAGGTRE